MYMFTTYSIELYKVFIAMTSVPYFMQYFHDNRFNNPDNEIAIRRFI